MYKTDQDTEPLAPSENTVIHRPERILQSRFLQMIVYDTVKNCVDVFSEAYSTRLPFLLEPTE